MPIPGPVGAIEAQHDRASAGRAITAVLCHPHPQYGGSMHDAVLNTAAQALLGAGVSCLRFNFRGVGASDGRFDQGEGETDDLIAVVDWLASEHPGDALWLVGYSFGAAVSWRALARCNPALTILIAPPVGMMPFAEHATLSGKVTALAGDQDSFVDQAAFAAWAGVETHVVAGADHFFGGHHDDLGNLIADAATG